MSSLLGKIRTTLEMIKFEHTVFALPFAFLGAVLASRGLPGLTTSGLILLAMAGARSAAMAFNRLVDAEYDRQNPRTSRRAIPQGLLSRAFVAGFTVLSAATFVFAAGMLNRLCLLLSLPALVIVLFYSFTKRFTALSHVVLGLSLSIAPAGGWIAVRGSLDPGILVVCAVVVAWVSGFDILYSCQDAEFDSRMGLHSIPAKLGVPLSLRLSTLFHFFTVLGLIALWIGFHLSWLALGGIIFLIALLVYEHAILSPRDLGRINTAFFTLNGVFSILLLLVVTLDILLLTSH